MIFAYADPPYIGQAKKHYSGEALCAEVDHAALIESLVRDYTDGWALSLSTPSLKTILPMCPQEARVMAWVKPFASFKPGVNPAYAWEPVIVCGGRKMTRKQQTVRDWVSANITLKKGLCGVKPEGFCVWLFDVLNIQPEDELIDLFPGSGAVTRHLEEWREDRGNEGPTRRIRSGDADGGSETTVGQADAAASTRRVGGSGGGESIGSGAPRGRLRIEDWEECGG